MITLFFEVFRDVKNVMEERKIGLVSDDIISFSDKVPNDSDLLLNNFLTINFREESIFFKYLVK